MNKNEAKDFFLTAHLELVEAVARDAAYKFTFEYCSQGLERVRYESFLLHAVHSFVPVSIVFLKTHGEATPFEWVVVGLGLFESGHEFAGNRYGLGEHCDIQIVLCVLEHNASLVEPASVKAKNFWQVLLRTFFLGQVLNIPVLVEFDKKWLKTNDHAPLLNVLLRVRQLFVQTVRHGR
jgi:hypothetical protein